MGGKLALDLQARGYGVFAWSARPENPWRQFVREISFALQGDFSQQYDRWLPSFESEAEHAAKLFELLMEQFKGHVVIFFDNLETIQDPDTLEIQDKTVAAWIKVAYNIQGLILLATSRWQLSSWSGEHLPLSHANYGDFLQMVHR